MKTLTIEPTDEFATLGTQRRLSQRSVERLLAGYRARRDRCQREGRPAPPLSILIAEAMQREVERS